MTPHVHDTGLARTAKRLHLWFLLLMGASLTGCNGRTGGWTTGGIDEEVGGEWETGGPAGRSGGITPLSNDIPLPAL